eukprot:GDKJ01028713.1.p1 GENE.GDKJ01028713.1~~GDKJ01028713.1.p1  ORF type:complete len:1291 (-),score=207.53 GDKJ01028713.1:122-3784(-)
MIQDLVQERNVRETYFLKWKSWKLERQKEKTMISWFRSKLDRKKLMKVFHDWSRQTQLNAMIVSKNRQLALDIFDAWSSEASFSKSLRFRIESLQLVRAQRCLQNFFNVLSEQVARRRDDKQVEQIRAKRMVRLVVTCFDFWREKAAGGAVFRAKIRLLRLKNDEKKSHFAMLQLYNHAQSSQICRNLVEKAEEHYKQTNLVFYLDFWKERAQRLKDTRTLLETAKMHHNAILLKKAIISFQEHSLRRRKVKNSLALRMSEHMSEALHTLRNHAVARRSDRQLERCGATLQKILLLKSARRFFARMEKRVRNKTFLLRIGDMFDKRRENRLSKKVVDGWKEMMVEKRKIISGAEILMMVIRRMICRSCIHSWSLLTDEERLIEDVVRIMNNKRQIIQKEAHQILLRSVLARWNGIVKTNKLGEVVAGEIQKRRKREVFRIWLVRKKEKDDLRDENETRLYHAYLLRLRFKMFQQLKTFFLNEQKRKLAAFTLAQFLLNKIRSKTLAHFSENLKRTHALESLSHVRIERQSHELVAFTFQALSAWREWTKRQIELRDTAQKMQIIILRRRLHEWRQVMQAREAHRYQMEEKLRDIHFARMAADAFVFWKKSTVNRFHKREGAGRMGHVLRKVMLRLSFLTRWRRVVERDRMQESALETLMRRVNARRRKEVFEQQTLCFDSWRQWAEKRGLARRRCAGLEAEGLLFVLRTWRLWAQEQAFNRVHSLKRYEAHSQLKTLRKAFSCWEDGACESANIRHALSRLVRVLSSRLLLSAFEILRGAFVNGRVWDGRLRWLEAYVVVPLRRRQVHARKKQIFSAWLRFAEDEAFLRMKAEKVIHAFVKRRFENWKHLMRTRQVERANREHAVCERRDSVLRERCFLALREFARIEIEKRQVEMASEQWYLSRLCLKMLHAWQIVVIKTKCWKKGIDRFSKVINHVRRKNMSKCFWVLYKRARQSAAVERLVCLMEFHLHWLGEARWTKKLMGLQVLQRSWQALTSDHMGDNPFAIAMSRVDALGSGGLGSVVSRAWLRGQLSESFIRWKYAVYKGYSNRKQIGSLLPKRNPSNLVAVDDALLTHLFDDKELKVIVRGVVWKGGLWPGGQTSLKIGDGAWSRARIRFELSMMKLGGVMVNPHLVDPNSMAKDAAALSDLSVLEDALLNALSDFVTIYLPFWMQEEEEGGLKGGNLSLLSGRSAAEDESPLSPSRALQDGNYQKDYYYR